MNCFEGPNRPRRRRVGDQMQKEPVRPSATVRCAGSFGSALPVGALRSISTSCRIALRPGSEVDTRTTLAMDTNIHQLSPLVLCIYSPVSMILCGSEGRRRQLRKKGLRRNIGFAALSKTHHQASGLRMESCIVQEHEGCLGHRRAGVRLCATR
jgi:hypothetical protein